jgi:hypothetical protein
MNESTPSIESLVGKATKNICDILTIAIEHSADHKALVIYDTENC